MNERRLARRAVIWRALGNRALRRVEIAYGLAVGAEWAVWIAFLVYGYTHGGPTGAMAITLVQVVPTALLAPSLGMLASRYSAGRVLLTGYLAETALLVAAGALIALVAPKWSVFASAALVSLSITVTRPMQAAFVPALVRTPEELTASNVLAGWSENAWKLIAPAVAGVLMALHGPALAIAGTSVMALVATVLVAPVSGLAKVRLSADDGEQFGSSLSKVVHDRSLRVLLGVQCIYQVIVGATDFLMVILALSILHIGQGGAGYLNAALGAGGLLAGLATVRLIGRSNLAAFAIFTLLSTEFALAALGFNSLVLAAYLLLGLVGFGGGLFDVTARTLLQRAAPPDSLASAFAVLESFMDTGLAVGVLIARGAFVIGGARGAFWIPALSGAVIVVVLCGRLLSIDHSSPVPHVQIELLRSIPIFAGLSGPALEGVAHQLTPTTAPAGTIVIRQGDPGDRYYLIADGTLSVSRDGVDVATIGRGQGFGEIALISPSPRTATIRAKSDVIMYSLDKDQFVLVLTGHAAAHEAAKATAAGHLRSLGIAHISEGEDPSPSGPSTEPNRDRAPLDAQRGARSQAADSLEGSEEL